MTKKEFLKSIDTNENGRYTKKELGKFYDEVFKPLLDKPEPTHPEFNCGACGMTGRKYKCTCGYTDIV